MTLSREQIEQMPAGPELDELVCTLVLGWRPPDRTDEASDPPPFPIPRDERWDYFNPPSVVEEWRNSYFWRAPNTGCHRRPARFSTDISAAWEVVEKIRDGRDIHIESSPYNGVPGWTVSTCFEVGEWKGWVGAETLPLAVCRAALLAVIQ